MIAQQFDLFGGMSAPAGLNLADKVAYILEHYPESRDDDKVLLVRFWQEFDGLDGVLDEKMLNKFLAWFTSAATNPETVRRRRQEHQQLRDGGGHLLPSGGVAEYRRARDGAGPPRR